MQTPSKPELSFDSTEEMNYSILTPYCQELQVSEYDFNYYEIPACPRCEREMTVSEMNKNSYILMCENVELVRHC